MSAPSMTVPPSVVPFVSRRVALKLVWAKVTPKKGVPPKTGWVLGAAKTSMSEPTVVPSTAPPMITLNRSTGLAQAANDAAILARAAATSTGSVPPVTANVSSSAAVSSMATSTVTTAPSGPATAFQRAASCGATPSNRKTKARAVPANGAAPDNTHTAQLQRTMRDIVRFLPFVTGACGSARLVRSWNLVSTPAPSVTSLGGYRPQTPESKVQVVK